MTIEQYNFAGKKAIVRVDFNVPLDENGKITDDTRIRGALPTLKKILADGGALIIMSHMGKPKGKVNAKLSLSQIKDAVAAALGTDVKFAPDCAKAADAAAALKPGEVLLLENLRFYAEEEGKPRGLAEDATDEEKAAAKTTAKKTTRKPACKVSTCVELNGLSVSVAEVEAAVKKAVKASGAEATDVKIYINATEQAAYYTVDGAGDATNKVDLKTL